MQLEQTEAEFKEFKPWLNYGWFHLKLYKIFQDCIRLYPISSMLRMNSGYKVPLQMISHTKERRKTDRETRNEGNQPIHV